MISGWSFLKHLGGAIFSRLNILETSISRRKKVYSLEKYPWFKIVLPSVTIPDLEITTIKILINSLITKWIRLYREFFHFNYCEIIPICFPQWPFFISVRWDCPPSLIFHFQANKYWGETLSGSRCTHREESQHSSLYIPPSCHSCHLQLLHSPTFLKNQKTQIVHIVGYIRREN